MKNKLSKIIIILVIFGILLPGFSFSQQGVIEAPKNLKEAKKMGKTFIKSLPKIFKEIWQEGSRVAILMYQKARDIWNTYIFPWLDKFVLEKIKKRKPLIEEEFKKEKTEMGKEIKTEIPQIRKSLWQKLKELIE